MSATLATTLQMPYLGQVMLLRLMVVAMLLEIQPVRNVRRLMVETLTTLLLQEIIFK